MKITEPLRFNYEFARVYKRGAFVSGRCLVLYAFHRSERISRGRVRIPMNINRMGVTSSRKIKGAVARNHMKRLMRECYRFLEPELITGYDLIFMMKETQTPCEFAFLQKEMKSLLGRAGILPDNR